MSWCIRESSALRINQTSTEVQKHSKSFFQFLDHPRDLVYSNTLEVWSLEYIGIQPFQCPKTKLLSCNRLQCIRWKNTLNISRRTGFTNAYPSENSWNHLNHQQTGAVWQNTNSQILLRRFIRVFFWMFYQLNTPISMKIGLTHICSKASWGQVQKAPCTQHLCLETTVYQ